MNNLKGLQDFIPLPTYLTPPLPSIDNYIHMYEVAMARLEIRDSGIMVDIDMFLGGTTRSLAR